MKRKFLSICLCFMMCLTSMLFLSACGEEKPVPVAEAVAMDALNNAMTSMENEKAFKMTCQVPQTGEMVVISSQDKMYMKVPGTTESWMTKNGEVFDVYTIENVSNTNVPEYKYTKSIMPAVQEESSENIEESLSGLFGDMGELFEDMEFKFSSASEFEGVLSINFALEFDGEILYNIVFKIENEKLISMSMRMFGVSITYNIQYGEQYLQEIPEIPTQGITWVETSPYIYVSGIKTQFEVGEELSLDEVELYFYEDWLSYEYQDYDITFDMIEGFDTTTATEEGQPRTMTVTFCGLTYDIEYTVTEPATN